MSSELKDQLLAALQWLGLAPWSASLVVLAMVGAFWFSKKVLPAELPHDSLRQGFLLNLRRVGQGWRYYRIGLDRALRRLDYWIGDDTVNRRGTARISLLSDWFRGNANPWTDRSYDWCLRLALLYPFLGLSATWLVSGVGRLGTLPILETAHLGWRLLIVASLLAFGFVFKRFLHTSGWRSWAYFAIAVAFSLAGAGAGVGVGAGGVAADLAGAAVGVFVVAVAFAVVGAVPVGIAIGAAVAGAVGVAVAVAFSLAVPAAGAGAVAVAGIVVLPVAFVVALGIYFLSNAVKRQGMAGAGSALFWAGMLGMLLTALWLGEPSEASSLPLLLLGFLPLVNAPLDWISLGLTRGLLREALVRRGAWGLVFSTFDLLLAMGLMVPLICLTVGIIRVANMAAGGGEAPFDLGGVIAEIRQSPADPAHYWVYFMFFSTLIPTLIHAGLAVVGMITGIVSTFGIVADKVEQQLKATDGYKSTSLSVGWPLVIGALVGVLLVGVFAAIAHVPILPAALGWFGRSLLAVASWAATVGT